MAVPASFDESNGFLSKPEGLTDDQCVPLSILRIDQDGLPTVISCWKLTQEELDEINRTGRVWLGVVGNTMPPAYIAGVKPFSLPNPIVEQPEPAQPVNPVQPPCPRMIEQGGPFRHIDMSHVPEDGSCHYCGSLLGDIFMARLETGDIELGPTDKGYKVYVTNKGGQPFKRHHSGTKMSDGSYTWKVDYPETTKFYFQHLTDEQQDRFVELLNAKKIQLGYPGYFYRLPFFISPKEKRRLNGYLLKHVPGRRAED